MGLRLFLWAALTGLLTACAGGDSAPRVTEATKTAETPSAVACSDCTAAPEAGKPATAVAEATAREDRESPGDVVLAAAPAPAATRAVGVPLPPPDLDDGACYSVDLFDRVEIGPPPPGTPPDYARLLGFWGDGAWNGEWCHEMVITGVTPDGRVNLIDMQAPSEKYQARATAFQRTGRIGADGVLTVRHGAVERRYVMREGTLHAVREGPKGRFSAVLEREANVQVAMVEAAAAMQVTAADFRDRERPVQASVQESGALTGAAARDSAGGTAAGAGAVAVAARAEAAATPAGDPEAAAPEGLAADGSRVALVIGNAAYRDVPDLENPGNDAADIARVLGSIGFSVTRLDDADFQAFRLGLRAFRERAARAEVAIVYYAGHGVEIDRQNFMLPVDARLASLGDVSFEAIPLGLLENAAAPAARLSLVIVDACRNNPFLERLPAASRSLSRGLIAVEPVGRDRLVAFAAREGTVASDGAGRNSPYAEALKAELATPGLEIGKLFRRVHDRVHRATAGAQQPALYGSLSAEDFYFLPPPGGGGA